MRCKEKTRSGRVCKLTAMDGRSCCHVHGKRQAAEEECSVCMMPMRTELVTLECEHTYHVTCLKQWLEMPRGNQTCPYCRAYIPGTVRESIGIPDHVKRFKDRLYAHATPAECELLGHVIFLYEDGLVRMRVEQPHDTVLHELQDLFVRSSIIMRFL